MHRKLLYKCSPYFRTLLNSHSILATSPQELCLPDDDPYVFADFVFWAYYGSIRSKPKYTLFSGDHGSSHIQHLYHLWTLAEKLKVPDLQALAMETCRRKLDENPSELVHTRAVYHAYSCSPEGSDLRRLAVDTWAKRATKAMFLERQKDLPRDFLRDLNVAWLEAKENTLDVYAPFYYVYTYIYTD
jgi:BTB/POZ domain